MNLKRSFFLKNCQIARKKTKCNLVFYVFYSLRPSPSYFFWIPLMIINTSDDLNHNFKCLNT